MRKFTILMTLIGLTVFVFGQKTRNLKDELNLKSHRNSTTMYSNSKGIAAEIIPVSKYKADSTMDLVFSLTLTSPDIEYGDYLELTFPEGIKPIGGSDPFVRTNSPDSLNEIDGQVISWGKNNNDGWGGIPKGTIKFFVTAEIDGTRSGDQRINYYVSGDMYGASEPHEVYGTIILQELPIVPDLKITPTGFIVEYFSVPLDQVTGFSQVTSTIQAIIENVGANLTEATNATVTVTNDFADEKAINVPLGTYMYDTIVFADFAATKIGRETFTFTANTSNDFDTENATATAEIEISETDLIRDNGEVLQGWTLGTPGWLGNLFVINSRDTLNAVTVYLTEPTLGDEISVDVFEMLTDGNVGEIIASSNPFVVTANSGEFTAYFAGEGVVLEAGKYIFAVKEEDHGIALANTSTYPVPDGTSWMYAGPDDGWVDLATWGMPLTFYIRPGFGTELPGFDMAFYGLDLYKYAIKGGNLTVSGSLVNKGLEPLTSIDISYTVNGGTPVTESLTGLNGFNIIPFSFSTPISLTEIGDYNIKVYFTNPNGANDADVTNDTTEFLVTAIEYAPHKNILGEEGTGTWCGFCVRGHVLMDIMAEQYPDNWIGIAVHNNDPMVVPEYDSGLGDNIGGYPSGLVNRMGIYDPMDFALAYNALIDLPSPVAVDIANIVYNATSGELTFDVNADFLATLKDTRFNAVIVENNVTGDGNGYNQANYYAGGAMGPMGGYENLPNPVPAEDMVYQHVARAILGGWSGTEGSIPATVSAGDSKTQTYSMTLSEDLNVAELKIVGMVIDGDGSILNSVQAPVITPMVTVTFNVDMTQPIADAAFFVAGTDMVYVTGSFNGWDKPGTGESILMSDTDGDNIYTASVEIAANAGAITYKYFKNATWDFGDNAAGDRPLTIADANITTNDTWVHVSDVSDNLSGSLTIYPNPVNNQLTIQSANKLESIKIYNVVGKVTMEITNPALIEKIDMTKMAAGVYFIEVVSSEQQKAIYKISKQ